MPLTTAACDCQRKANNSAMLRSLGLDKQAAAYTFDAYTTEKEWQAKVKSLALDYCRQSGNEWFFIAGQSGSGKTHICIAIVNELIKRSGKLEYFRWVDDSRLLKSLAKNEDRAEAMKRYKGADLLYIDDFLKTEPTEADKAIAFELLNGAYTSGQTVIISSERTLPQINAWDEAIAGRIKERSGKYCFSLTGHDKNYRLKNT